MSKDILKIWLTVGVVLLISSGTVFAHKAKTTKNGFDQLCDIYTRVFTEKKYALLTLKQKASMIDSMVHKTLTSVDAIEAYSAIWRVAPSKRYKIMQESAEYSLKKPWKCNELKKIYLINTGKAPTQQDGAKGKDRQIGSQ